MKRLLALAAIAPALLAQNYGVVIGTVSDSMSRSGIAGATVQLRSVDGRFAGYTGRTNTSGQFRIDNVLPGDYTASYQANNYAPPEFSQGAYRAFHVIAGGEPVQLRVELAPLGKLSARVLDEEGHPASGVQVLLLRLHGPGGLPAATDAQGRVEIKGVLPGVYILMARPVAPGSIGLKNAEQGSPLPEHPKEGDRYGWAATYFPNALERAQAEPIRMRGGSDLSGYEIRLKVVPVYRVSGAVVDERGGKAPNAQLKLIPAESFFGGGEQTVSTGEDGQFVFPSVPAGEWKISAEKKLQAIALKAASDVTVTDRDVGDVTVRLSPSFVVSGVVDREEARDVQGVRRVTAVRLEGEGQVLNSMSFHQQDGQFEIKDVYPGRYRIIPLGFVPNYYLDSVWLGGRNVMGQEVDLSPGVPPIRVVYKPNAARVRGTVEDGAGSVVYLLPQDESLLDGQFIRSIACDSAGRFEVGSLRPGDYYAFAFDRVEFAALTDPSFVRMLAAQAVPVHVDAGEIGTVNLKVTAWPE